MDEDPRWKNSRMLPFATGVAEALRSVVGEKLERLEMKLGEKAVST